MPYIDGFIIPVPKTRREDYLTHEAKWWPYFRDRGAQSLVVALGDHLPKGKQTDFLRSVDARDDEIVVFAWMTWPDKETRDRAYGNIEDSMEAGAMMDMPFDGKRMIYGGFIPALVEGTTL